MIRKTRIADLPEFDMASQLKVEPHGASACSNFTKKVKFDNF